jgi:hypothetical protein
VISVCCSSGSLVNVTPPSDASNSTFPASPGLVVRVGVVDMVDDSVLKRLE